MIPRPDQRPTHGIAQLRAEIDRVTKVVQAMWYCGCTRQQWGPWKLYLNHLWTDMHVRARRWKEMTPSEKARLRQRVSKYRERDRKRASASAKAGGA